MRAIKNWLAGLLGGRTRSRRGTLTKPPPRRRLLLLEPLEDRTMPSAGMLDLSFGQGGQVTRPVGGWGDAGYMAIQSNGKIVLASSYFTETGSRQGYDVTEVVRFNADGSPDDGSVYDSTPGDQFGTNGVARITVGQAPSSTGFRATSIALQPLDGTEKIVLAGASGGSDFALCRLNADGTLDATFNNNTGSQAIDFGGRFDAAYGVAVQPDDGKIVVVGSSQGAAGSEFAVARLNRDGTLDDDSFGTGGRQTFGFDGFQYAHAGSVAFQSEGRIVVAGSANNLDSLGVAVVARLDSNGNLDDSFGTGGKRTLAFDGFDGSAAYGVVVQGDELILAGAGYVAGQGVLLEEVISEAVLVRLNGDGTADSSFGPNGQRSFTFDSDFSASYDSASSLALQDDGKLIVAGVSWTVLDDVFDGGSGFGSVIGLARLNSNGTLDQTFGTGGKRTLAFTRAYSFGVVALQPMSGSIIVGGESSAYPYLDYALARVLGQDSDNDGIEDRLQSNLASVRLADPEAQYSVTLAVPQGLRLSDVSAASAPPPEQAPAGAEFPVGVLSFAVEGVSPGGTTTVIIYMPPGTQADAYYKQNRTSGLWELYEDASFVDRNGDGTPDIVLTLTDGGPGDDDGQVNGRIVDPGLPAFRLAVHEGQTASIGFWQSQNGQDLIKKLNGGPDSRQLSAWLAATFPNLYGVNAGANNLTGMTNEQVAAFYVGLFQRTGGANGPPKLDSQVLALALAVYVTDQELAGTAAVSYGFEVTAAGVGAATYEVGSANRAAFGMAPAQGTVLSVLDILEATDALSRHGRLYDVNDSGTIDKWEKALRSLANTVYAAINEQGGI